MSGPRSRSSSHRPRAVHAWLVAMAVAFCLANAIKPPHIDDPFTLRVAQRIAEHPFDPYGFDIFWMQWPQPLHEELIPPLLPYWSALGLVVLGDRPFLLKLWLAPFAFILVFALGALLRRFARGFELPWVALTLLSPALLPSFNLMQDIPAVSLGLAAMALYLRACDRGRSRGVLLALLAGLVAGLAAQTKFTMLTLPPVMLLLGLLRRRPAPALAAAGAALAVFAGWEGLITLRYGHGMLVGQLRQDLYWYPRAAMVLPLLQLLGGCVPALGLAGAWALGLPRRAVAVLVVTLLAAFGSILVVPTGRTVFAVLGALLVVVLAAGGARLLRGGRLRAAGRATSVWLVLWLLVETAGYFATAPFPAVRRVLGICIVASLLLARLASRLERRRPTARFLPVVVASGVLIAVGVGLVDLREAFAQREAISAAVARVRGEDPDARIWFIGHWGFQYHAERAGLRPVVPDSSRLAAGDWLIVPSRVHRQDVALGTRALRAVETLAVANGARLRSCEGFYAGSEVVAHHEGPLLTVTLYRVLEDHVPATPWSAAQLVQWVRASVGRTAAAAAPALGRALGTADAGSRRIVLAGLEELGAGAAAAVPALARTLSDSDVESRRAAARVLAQMGPAATPAREALEAAAVDPDEVVRDHARAALARLAGR